MAGHTEVALAANANDPLGRVYAAWNRGDAIAVSTWQGGIWGTPVTASPLGVGASHPTIAAGDDGQVLVAWTQGGEVEASFVGGFAWNVSNSPVADSSSPSAAYVSGLGYVVVWSEFLAEHSFAPSRGLAEATLTDVGWTAPVLLYVPTPTTDTGIATVTVVAPAAADGATLAIPFTTLDTHTVRVSGNVVTWHGGGWSAAETAVYGGQCGDLGAGLPGGEPVVVGRDCTGGYGAIRTSTGVTLAEGSSPDIVSAPVTATAAGTMLAAWSQTAGLLARSSSDGRTWAPADTITPDAPVTPVAAIGAAGGSLFVAYATAAGEIRSVHLGTPPAPTKPSISGQARQGQFLTTTLGTLPAGAQPMVQWLRCDAAGANCVGEPDLANPDRDRPSTEPATSEYLRYLLTAADVGSTIRSEITAIRGEITAGWTALRSDPTTVVAATAGLPSSVALPQVSGPAPPEVTLTASTGAWTNAPTSYAYHWVNCGYADPACSWWSDTSTVPTLRLPWDDNDRGVRVLVTATNAAGSVQALSTKFRYSAPLSVYALPHIGGTATVGSRLYVDGGAWSGAVLSQLGPEEWLRCDAGGSNCVVVASGVAGAGYVVTGADVGSTLRATTTLVPFGGGGSFHLVTPPTGVSVTPGDGQAGVSAALSVYALPHVDGTAVVGSRLSVSGGGWSGADLSAGGPEQWLRCDASGSSCDVVASGVSGAGYVPTSADVGSTLRATMTLTPFGGGGSLHLVTPPTSLVAAATPSGGGSGGGSSGGGGGGGGSGVADLRLEGTVEPAQAAVGDSITWRITVNDYNTGPALDVYVDIALPASVSLTHSYTDRGTGCTVVADNELRCQLDWLADTVQFGHVILVTKVTATGDHVLTAITGYRSADPVPADNTVTLRATTPSPSPPVTVVTPVVGRAAIVPGPVAGKRVTVSFRVTRSDNGAPLTRATMICDPSVAGKVIKHAEQFKNGVARLSFVIPKNAKGKQLKVKLTIKAAGTSSTKIAIFHVR